MVDNVEAFLQMEFNWRISKDFSLLYPQVIAPVSGIGTDISARLTGSFNNMEFQELIVLI
jgi:hypothetical protein